MSDRLPELIDRRGLMAELNVTKAAAERIMRQLPKVTFDGLDKAYVRRADVLRLMREHAA